MVDRTGTARYLTSDLYAPQFLARKGGRFRASGWQQALLALCSRDELIAAIAAATRVAESPEELEAWAEYVLSAVEADLAATIRAALADPGPPMRFLARQPLLLAMRIALTEPEAAAPGGADPRVVAALLSHHAAGTVNNPRRQRRAAHGGSRQGTVTTGDGGSHGDVEPVERSIGGVPEPLAMSLIANALFNASLNYGDLIARTRLLWTEYESQLLRFPPRAPLAEMIRDATGGIEIDDLLAMAFGLFAHANTTGLDAGGPLDLAKLGISAESTSRFLDLFADDRPGFAAALNPPPSAVVSSQQSEWSFIPFELKPLLRMGPSEALVIDARLLQRRFTQALYWLVHDHEKAVHGDTARNRWTQTYSELIEIHAEHLARSFAPTVLDGEPAFFTEERIAKLGGANADFGIDFGSFVVVADVVQHQFVVATRAQADPCAFATDLRRAVVDKAQQLDKSIRMLLERTNHPDHPLGRRPSRVVPIVVAGADFPGIPFVYKHARRAVADAGRLRQVECTKLLIVTLSELEMLSTVLASEPGLSAGAVIEGYLDDETDGSLTNYLYRLNGGAELARAPLLSEPLHEALADVERRLLTNAGA